MNPLASPNCVRRLLMALAAISGIFLTVGCGSSNSPTPNPVGFSNSSLNGTYVFSSQGVDANGAPLALAGALVANGNGGVSGGTIDIVDIEVAPVSPVAQPITGSYSVSSDGRGQATLTSTAYGPFTFAFVLTSNSHGLLTEFDGNGGGSGTIDLQTLPTGLAGPYAFSLAGSDSNGFPFATAGAFALNSSGTSTAGVQDFNDNGVPFTQGALTATATLGSGTGPGLITLSANFGPLSFDFYPIDSTHFKLIETDYIEFLAGDAFTQTGASIPTGPMVFTMSGGTNGLIANGVANGGLMTSDGTGNFSGGLEDVNNGGSVPPQVNFTGALDAGESGPVGGRVFVDLTGFFPATNWVIYPSSGGLLMLEMDHAAVTAGVAYAQQVGAAIAPAQAYGLNLSAFNIAGPNVEDDIAQFTTTSTGFSGIVDINDNFGVGTVLSPDLSLSGTYTLDSPSTGRGEATSTAGGVQFVGFTFYAVNPSTILFLETDSVQIGTGIFEAQSAPEGMAQSRFSLVHPAVLRPEVRSRLAKRHK